MEQRFDLDSTFAALSDPTRRAILARLAEGEATVNELVEPFEMTQPAISQHLKVLEDAGLIVRRVEGTKRPRRLAKAGIEAMDQWLTMLRQAMEKNYDRLDHILADQLLAGQILAKQAPATVEPRKKIEIRRRGEKK